VLITQPGLASSFKLPWLVHYSLSSATCLPFSSSELTISLRLSPIVFNIFPHVFSALPVINLACSTFLISSYYCLIAVSMSAISFLAMVGSLSVLSTICSSFSSLLEQYIPWHCSTARFFIDCMLCNAAMVRTSSPSKVLLMAFVWWHCRLDHIVNLPSMSYWCGERLFFWSIDHCNLHWLCHLARCWMLHDMDHMVASCVFYIKVGMHDQHEQSKLDISIVTTLRIVILKVY